MGTRLHLSEATFPVSSLIPLIKRYQFEHQRGVGPSTWVVEIFIDLGVPYEDIFAVLETMLYNDEAPFMGNNRGYIAGDMLFVATKWFADTCRGAGKIFGSDEQATAVLESLQTVMTAGGLSREKVEDCQALRLRITQMVR